MIRFYNLLQSDQEYSSDHVILRLHFQHGIPTSHSLKRVIPLKFKRSKFKKSKSHRINLEGRNVQTFSSLFDAAVTSSLILVFPLLFLLRSMLVCAFRNFRSLLNTSAFFMSWVFYSILWKPAASVDSDNKFRNLMPSHIWLYHLSCYLLEI